MSKKSGERTLNETADVFCERGLTPIIFAAKERKRRKESVGRAYSRAACKTHCRIPCTGLLSRLSKTKTEKQRPETNFLQNNFA
jgi:hypothetical protein